MWNRSTLYLWLVKALIIAMVFSYQILGSGSISEQLKEQVDVLGYGMVLFWGLFIYAFLLALPYIPSVEIGFAIMMLFGKPGVLFAYVATLLGFLGAFVAGHLVNKFNLENHALFRVCKSEITFKLARKSPFFALIALINLPGNVVIGGGGGISLNYGFSKQLNIFSFMLAIALGVAPLPLLMLLGYSL